MNGKELIEFIKDNDLYDYNITDIYKEARRITKIKNDKETNVNVRISKNEIIELDNYAIVKVYNTADKIFYDVLIDKEDINKIKKYYWVIRKKYPATMTDKKYLAMHRLIMDYNGENDVDHINKDKLDNRKENLRIVTRVENLANNNASGIYLYKNKKYHVIFNRYGRTYNVGYFNTIEEATTARDSKLKEIKNNKELLLKEYFEKRKTYIKGIRLTETNRWCANIIKKGKVIHIGTFDTKEEAIKAREEALQTSA